MAIDLDCAATYGAIITIFGDTFALLFELSERDKEANKNQEEQTQEIA